MNQTECPLCMATPCMCHAVPLLRQMFEPEKMTLEPARCVCGVILSKEGILAGYHDAITGKNVCEVCWEQGEPLEGPHG